MLHFQHLGDFVEEGCVFGSFDRVVDGVGWWQGGTRRQAVKEVARCRPVGHFGAEAAEGTLNAGNVCDFPVPPRQRLQPHFGDGGNAFGRRRTAQTQGNQLDEADDDGVVDFFWHVI